MVLSQGRSLHRPAQARQPRQTYITAGGAAPSCRATSTRDQLESTVVQLESTRVQLESNRVQLESTRDQLESTVVQLESTVYPFQASTFETGWCFQARVSLHRPTVHCRRPRVVRDSNP